MSASHIPPAVTRGVKWQTGATFDRRTVHIDWFRGVCPREMHAELLRVLSLHGVAEWEPARPRWTFAHAVHSPAAFGAQVLYDERDSVRQGGPLCLVELPGACLARVTDHRRLLRDLALIGVRVTRLDVAMDVYNFRRHDDSGTLVDCVAEAGLRGQVVGARTVRTDYRSDNHGEWLGRTVYLGVRGSNGSGRFVRCYDKGLEQGGKGGEWERLECEYTDDPAMQVFARLVASEDWISFSDALIDAIFSAVDFREVATSADRHLDRRPRLAFWAALCSRPGLIVRGRPKLRPALATVCKWLANGPVAALTAMAQAAGVTVAQLIDYLDPCRPSSAYSRVAAEWSEEVRSLKRAGVFPA
jgi:hypothetical protein